VLEEGRGELSNMVVLMLGTELLGIELEMMEVGIGLEELTTELEGVGRPDEVRIVEETEPLSSESSSQSSSSPSESSPEFPPELPPVWLLPPAGWSSPSSQSSSSELSSVGSSSSQSSSSSESEPELLFPEVFPPLAGGFVAAGSTDETTEVGTNTAGV